MRLYRPPAGGGDQLFFGTYDDVTRRVAYSPLQKQSEFCAPCHQFSFWGTPIYESFAEWQASAYATQGCAMPGLPHAPDGSALFCPFPKWAA